MADVTVSQFAQVLKVPVDRLIVQLDQAGIKVEGPDDRISDEAKLELLSHLRKAHGSDEQSGGSPNKITLKRKTQSELKLASTQGRARTVNVEGRRSRTYVKRDVLEGQNRQHLGEGGLKRREEAGRREAESREAERRETERVEAETRRRIEEEQNRKKAQEDARRAAEQQAREEAERREREQERRVSDEPREQKAAPPPKPVVVQKPAAVQKPVAAPAPAAPDRAQ